MPPSARTIPPLVWSFAAAGPANTLDFILRISLVVNFETDVSIIKICLIHIHQIALIARGRRLIGLQSIRLIRTPTCGSSFGRRHGGLLRRGVRDISGSTDRALDRIPIEVIEAGSARIILTGSLGPTHVALP